MYSKQKIREALCLRKKGWKKWHTFNQSFGNIEEHFNREPIGEYLKLETEEFLEDTGATM